MSAEQAGGRSQTGSRVATPPTWPQSLTVTPVSIALERKEAAERAEREQLEREERALEEAGKPPKRGVWNGTSPAAGSEVHDLHAMPMLSDELAPVVALTFDDGPGRFTADILDILKEEDVTATFFMLGIEVEGRPDDARAVAKAGFPIGSHTMDHRDLAKLGPDELDREIGESKRIIDEVVGEGTTQCMRAPFGRFSDEARRVAKRHELGLVGWDVDTEDWMIEDSARILARATGPGHRQLILLHDAGGDRQATVDALPGIIAHYKAQGTRFISLCGDESPPAPPAPTTSEVG